MPHILIFESDVFNIRLQRHKDTKLFLKLYSFEYTESAIKKNTLLHRSRGSKEKIMTLRDCEVVTVVPF